MFNILRKDFPVFVLYLSMFTVFIILDSIYWVAINRPFDMSFVMTIASIGFIFGLGPVIISEVEEEKYNGYKFLSPLPIKDSEIVTAKFLLVFIVDVLMIIIALLILPTLSPGTEVIELARSYILTIGSLLLLVTALIYIGVFSLGFTRMFKYIILIIAGEVVGTILLMEFKIFRSGESFEEFSTLAKDINWFIVVPAIIISYFLFMLIAVKVKKGNRLSVR